MYKMYDVPSKKEELENCNLIKTVMMLAVVIYHSCALWNKGGWFNQPPAIPSEFFQCVAAFLSSVHIYAFAFVSGYVYSYLKCEKKRYNNIKKDTLDRAKRLLIPYAAVLLFWCIPIHIWLYEFDAVELVKKYLFGSGPDHLWFLLMLFWLWTGFNLIFPLLDKLSIKGCLVVIGIGLLWPLLNRYLGIPSVFQFTSALRYFPMFLLGFVVRKVNLDWFYSIRGLIYAGLSIALFAFYYFVVYDVVLWEVVFRPVLNLYNAFASFIVINKIAKFFRSESKLFVLLKNNNFQIYLFHQQIIYFVITLLNGKVPNAVLFVCNLIVSVVGSLVISALLSRSRVLSVLIGKWKVGSTRSRSFK